MSRETSAAEQSTSGAAPKTFPCESCGADLEFNIGAQQLKCPYCSFEKQIALEDDASVEEQDLEGMLSKQASLRKHPPTEADHVISCTTCAAEVVFDKTVISSECPYCGSPVQSTQGKIQENKIPPDAVLPFLVEKSSANENLKKWVASRWFAPNEFKKRGVDGAFNGLYLPHWTFDAMTYCKWKGERGDHYYVKNSDGEKVRKTKWRRVRGSFQRFFDDTLVCAARDAKRALMEKLEPWPLEKLLPFNQESLAGYMAMTYEVDLPEGFSIGKTRMEDSLRQDVRRRIGGDKQRISSMDVRYDALTFKNVLLPVWMLAYRYKDKSYQLVVNACTGEVQGERPWSWVKIAAAAFVGLCALGALAWLKNQGS